MSDYFDFGGYIDGRAGSAVQSDYVRTSNFNAQVLRRNTETVLPMEYTFKQINGRSGDIIIPSNRFPNREKRFQVLVTGENAEYNTKTLVSRLLSYNGYQAFWSSFEPNLFYDAVISEPVDIETTRDRDIFKFNITFNCKPQKWLKSGLIEQTGSLSYSFVNPTDNTAYPLILFKGYGTISVYPRSGQRQRYIKLTNPNISSSRYVIVDCNTMECYSGGDILTVPSRDNNLNQYLTITNNSGNTVYDFPALTSGTTSAAKTTDIDVVSTSTITELHVVPRWYEL